MKYSDDLRERILRAVKEGKLKKTEIARYFNISRTGLNYFIRHVEETGGIKPKPHGKGRPSKFQDADIARVKQYLESHPKATLEEILEYTGIDASIMSLFRTLNKIGYKLKRSHKPRNNRNN